MCRSLLQTVVAYIASYASQMFKCIEREIVIQKLFIASRNCAKPIFHGIYCFRKQIQARMFQEILKFHRKINEHSNILQLAYRRLFIFLLVAIFDFATDANVVVDIANNQEKYFDMLQGTDFFPSASEHCFCFQTSWKEKKSFVLIKIRFLV
eukprot:UN02245